MLRLRCRQLLPRGALAPCTQTCVYAAASSAAATAVAATSNGGRTTTATAAAHRQRSLHTVAVRRSSSADGGSSSQLPHAANDTATAATAATATAAVPPPHPPDTPPAPTKGRRLRDLARRVGSAGASLGRGTWAAMRAPQHMIRKRPLATLLLALALALGAGWAIRRRAARQRERAALLAQHQAAMLSGQPVPAVVPEAVAKESHTVGAFVRPRWASSQPLRDLAALLNAMPQLAQQLRVGQHHQPLQCETTLSPFSSNNALTPVMTPAEAMEKLRVLLLDESVLNAVIKYVPPSRLLEPLISLLSHPAVDPAMAKYAAVCLNQMCTRNELCEQFAAHSNIDALVSLAHYTDFQAWNYLYLLQQEPERVRHFQQYWLDQIDAHHAQPNPLRLPVWLRPYHSSSTFPPAPNAAAVAALPADADTSLNFNTAPSFNFHQHFRPGDDVSPEEQARLHPVQQPTDNAAESQLIEMLLRLPLVSSEAKREQLGGVLQHLMERGLAQRSEGESLVQIGQGIKEEFLQAVHSKAAELQRSASVALTPALHSALAGDDLARVKEVYGHWRAREALGPRMPAFLTRPLHRFLARWTYGYDIGRQRAQLHQTARQQEIYYHAIRALATLATDPRTAATIVSLDGVNLLYRVYMRYPHELRVQLQVARALANLLEHAPPRRTDHPPDDYKRDPANSPLSHVVAQALEWTDEDKSASSLAAYTAVAHSGFLPMLVHWAQHALNYTDAAVTTAQSQSDEPALRHTVVSASDAASQQLQLPNPASVGTAPLVAISTRPSDPEQLHTQLDRIAQLKSVQTKRDEAPSLPIPPPVVHIPVSGNGSGAAAVAVAAVAEATEKVDPAAHAPPPLAVGAKPAAESAPVVSGRSNGKNGSKKAVAPVSAPPPAQPEPHPTQLPHHPDSSASLRNKLQLQSFRALTNLRSIQSYSHLDAHPAEAARWMEVHGGEVRFPILGDEVYLFHPFLDTLAPERPGRPRESKAQKHVKSLQNHNGDGHGQDDPKRAPPVADADARPVAPPVAEFDIVFIHGLMGNPLRTWRLHSMYDRTIGWIPSVVDERQLRRRLRRGPAMQPGPAEREDEMEDEECEQRDLFSDAEWSQSYSPDVSFEDTERIIRAQESDADAAPASSSAPRAPASEPLSPLALHLSNVVASAPPPPLEQPASLSAQPVSSAALSVATAASRVWSSDVHMPLVARVIEEAGKKSKQRANGTAAATAATQVSASAAVIGSGDGAISSAAVAVSSGGFARVDATSVDPSPAAPVEAAAAAAAGAVGPSDLEDPPHAPIHASQHSLDFETLWPRDWLPDAFPNARITSLGYSTALTMKSTGELHSRPLEERAAEMQAKMEAACIGRDGRKIIWITHSMGGLIVKQILLNAAMADEQERDRHAANAPPARAGTSPAHTPLLHNTVGTIFYSTPHMGTWIPSGINQSSLMSHTFYPSYELMTLQNVHKLRELNARFHRSVIDARGVQSLSMGEGIGTPLIHLNRTAQRIINWRFVMPDSSRPGFGRYLYFPTQNHLTICKPKTQLDENYSAVREFIAQQMRQEEERKKKVRMDAAAAAAAERSKESAGASAAPKAPPINEAHLVFGRRSSVPRDADPKPSARK